MRRKLEVLLKFNCYLWILQLLSGSILSANYAGGDGGVGCCVVMCRCQSQAYNFDFLCFVLFYFVLCFLKDDD